MKILNLFFSLILMILFVAMFTSCEKENLQQVQQKEEFLQPDLNVEISKKNISDLPKVNDRLIKTFELAQSNRIINSGGLPFTEDDLDLENVTVAVDNDANISNYTITINDIPSENVFYNIIISEDEQGNVGTPILYEFEMNPGFANQFKKGLKGLGDFKGTISRYNLLAFFDSNPLGGVVRNVIEPCEETEVDGGSSGGGSTGGTTGGDGGSTGGDGGSTGGDGGSGSTGGGDEGEPCDFVIIDNFCCICPEGCQTVVIIQCGETSALNPSPDDCPGQGGTAGVDYPDLEENEITCNSYDVIIEDASFVNCETYKCVSDYLNATSNNTLCELMDPLFDSDNYTVYYTTHSTGADGHTKIIDAGNKVIRLSFHSGDCDMSNTDLLFVAETLIHESQHARFKYELLQQGKDPNNWTAEVEKQAWMHYASENLGIAYQNEHLAMLDIYFEKAATTLWELNNRVLTIEHYKHYVYEGFSQYANYFTSSQIQEWNQKKNELNSGGYNNFTCN
jgi:uncharacterized membrane protein YgcG